MDFSSKWFGITIGAVIMYVSAAFRWVPKPYNWVIEINIPLPGAPTLNYVWKPGSHFMWLPIKPFMYVKNKVDMAQKRITLHMGMSDGAGRADPVDFKDTKAKVLAQVIYQVIDPIKATYGVQEDDLNLVVKSETGEMLPVTLQGYERATLNKVEADLRSFFGKFEFDQANEDSQKSDTETEVLNRIKKSIEDDWGVRVLEIDIIDFILEDSAAELRQKRLFAKTEAELLATVAEGQKKATITAAEGNATAIEKIAEANKNAARLSGEGEQNRLAAIKAAGLDPGHAAAYVIANGANETLGKASTTVIATSEGGNMSFPATLAGVFKGMMKGGNGNSPQTPPTPESPKSPQGSSTPNQGQQRQQQPPRQQQRPQQERHQGGSNKKGGRS